jgi:hypothetical protein
MPNSTTANADMSTSPLYFSRTRYSSGAIYQRLNWVATGAAIDQRLNILPTANIEIGFEVPRSDHGIQDGLDDELVGLVKAMRSVSERIDSGLDPWTTFVFGAWLRADGRPLVNFHLMKVLLEIEKSDPELRRHTKALKSI